MPAASSVARPWSWPAVAPVACLLLAVLAGCTTTTTTTSSEVRNTKDTTSTTPTQPDTDRLAQVRMDLATGYFARGQANDALDEIKLLLALRPQDAAAWGLRGMIFAALGDAGTAEDSLRKSLQLAPHNGDTMHNYGWFLCQQQRYPEADAQFAAALAEPTYRGTSRTLLARGVCLARSGNLPDAERTLAHAYEVDPANPATAVNLAQVLYREGEFERARFYIRRVNAKDDLVSAQSLWLAAQIEHRLGQQDVVQELGNQLHNRFPQAPESLLFERGRFDE